MLLNQKQFSFPTQENGTQNYTLPLWQLILCNPEKAAPVSF